MKIQRAGHAGRRSIPLRRRYVKEKLRSNYVREVIHGMKKNPYKRVARGLAVVEKWIIVVALAVGVALTAVNVVCRYIFKADVNFSWSEEIVVAILVLAYMVGAVLCAGEEGGLINMTIFTGKMSRRAQLIIEIVTNICLIAFGVIIFISGWDRCATKIASGQVTTALAVPDWIYNAFIPLGAFLMVIHTVERILDGIAELKELKNADMTKGGDAA